LITSAGGTVGTDDGALAVSGMNAATVGELAAANGIALHELVAHQATLEEAFFELTENSVEYQGSSELTRGR